MTDRRNIRSVEKDTHPGTDSKRRSTLKSASQRRDEVGQILDLVTHIIVALNREGRITMINRAGCRILGYQESELIGKDWFSTCFPVGVGDEIRDRFRRVITGENPISETYQIPIVTRGGEERVIDWHNAVLTDDDGRIVGTMSYGNDITERKRAETAMRKSEEMLQFFVENVPAAVAMFDRDMRYLAVSRRWITDYNLQKLNFIGRSHYEVFPEIPKRWKDVHRRCLAGASESCEEEPFVRIDGRVDWVRWAMHPWRTSNEEIGGTIIFSEVITARKNAEIALRASEQRYRMLVDASPYCVHELDLEGRFLSMNPAGIAMLGLRDKSEILGRSEFEFVAEGDKSLVNQHFAGARKGETCDFEFLTVDGRDFQSSFVPIRDSSGSVVKLMGLTLDITDRKRSEQALRESEERYRLLFERNLAGVFYSNPEGTNPDCNEAFVRMFGYDSKEELLARPITDLYPKPQDRVQFLEQLRTHGELTNFELTARRKDGTLMEVIENVALIRGADGREHIHGTIFDITEWKRAERALRENEERYRTVVEADPDGIVIVQEDRIVFANRAALALVRAQEPSELVGKFALDLLKADSHESAKARMSAVLEGNRAVPMMERDLLRCDGTTVEVETAAVPCIYSGKPAILAHIRDLTERKRAEVAFRQSEERQRLLLEGVRVIFWEADPKTFSFTYVTGQASALTGYDPEQWYAPGFWVDHLHPEDRDDAVAHCLAAIRRGEPHELEYRMRKADGRWIWLRDIVSVVVGPEGVQLLRGVLVDITDRKTADEQVARQQAELTHVARVSTVGEMASGLAHELNQPLTAVVNFAQGALRRLRSDANVHQDVLEAIETASSQAHRAAEIIRRLTTFVQKRQPIRSYFDINEAVREIVKLAALGIREQAATVRLDLAGDLPPVVADSIQIQQVILNLVRNGIEAMTGMESQERILEIRTSSLGDAVEVAVRDRGSGLTPEGQERIFTPFFTTKPQGMGMGLSISRSIIDAHGGRLWATPNPDRGTTFQFTIPVSHGAMSNDS